MECQSRGYRIHYLDEGEGQPLVLIPGNLLRAAQWLELGYVDAFRDGYRVLAIDPLGHRLSDRPRDATSYAPADVAADIVAVLDAEGIASAICGDSRAEQESP